MSLINRTMFPVNSGITQIKQLQERFATLQTQLATGQKATSLADMGTDRYFDLSVRSRMGRIVGYENNIDMTNLRLDVFDKVLARLDTIETDGRGGMVPGGYGTGEINFGTAPTLAKSRLDEVLNLLNTDVDGRHLFGGSVTDKKPVETLGPILDGVAGKAGFKQIAAERLQADLGTGNGRLTLGGATNTVTLTEDGDHPFGFKLSTLTTTSAGVTLSAPSGTPPQNLGVTFTSQPLEGETVTVGFTLPDGSEEGITLKAVTGTPGEGEFQIGVDVDATAANFSAALGTALTDMAGTKLNAASAFAAAENLFNGQGDPLLRVVGPSFSTATALATADPSTTVIWYKGEDAADPRATVGSRVDDGVTANYGVQANERGLVELVRSLATVAVQSFPSSDPTSKGRFDAVASRNIEHLAESHNNESGSIEMITVELGTTRAAAENVGDRLGAYKAQLSNMLSDIESISKEDVAMEMLSLQTRLTASYEATSLISQLSLVNYLR